MMKVRKANRAATRNRVINSSRVDRPEARNTVISECRARVDRAKREPISTAMGISS